MDIILALATMFVVLVVPALIVSGVVAAPDKSRRPARTVTASPELTEDHPA